VSLLFRFGVLFHLLKQFFFRRALLATRTAGCMALVIVMLVIRAGAKVRSIGFVAIHRIVLFAGPAMHQLRAMHNTTHVTVPNT
jgi:hypothetical protein